MPRCTPNKRQSHFDCRVCPPNTPWQIAALFAQNNACNNAQSSQALNEFAGNATVIERDDRKTADSLTPVNDAIVSVEGAVKSS